MKKFFVSLFLLVSVSTAAMAQFQGQISMNLYSENNNQQEVNRLNMYVTPDRIMIKGENRFNVNANIAAEGLLIRNDKKDFILMVESKQALQITKTEIEGLLEMITSWSGKSENSNEDEIRYRYTDRTRTIMGYKTAEMVIDTEDGKQSMSVWLTPEVSINWGMLSERWSGLSKTMDRNINGVSREAIFNGKNFPLLIEVTDEKGITSPLVEVTGINESSVAKAMVQVPEGVTLVSAREMIFRMMMQ